MLRTKKTEQIGELISKHSVTSDRFITWFVAHEDFDYSNVLTLDQYVNHFKQIFLNDCLEEIADKHPELGISSEAYPKEGDKSKHFVFRYDKSLRLFAYCLGNSGKINLKTGEPFYRAMYNRLIMADNKPVVIDMKFARWKSHGTGRNTGKDHKGMKLMGARRFLHRTEYDRKLLPIKDFYCGDDIGYIVVIPKDVYQQKKDGKVSRKFFGKGGIIVPFYAERLQFRQEVREMVAQYGLKIKD